MEGSPSEPWRGPAGRQSRASDDGDRPSPYIARRVAPRHGGRGSWAVAKWIKEDCGMRRWGESRMGMASRPRGTMERRPRDTALVLLALSILLAIVLTVLFVVAPAN